MPHNREVVRTAEAGRSAAHDGDALARVRRDPGPVVGLHVLAGVALDGADVHRVVHHAAAAVHLAGMLAHQAADQWQRVVLPDEAHGVRVAARLHERDVPRDVNPRRAARHARHELGLREAARVVLDMVHEVVVEAQYRLERHRARLVADRAVGRQVDAPRKTLDVVERLHGRPAGQHVRKHVPKHPEAHAARRALSAALGRAHVNKGHRELDRARRGELTAKRRPTASWSSSMMRGPRSSPSRAFLPQFPQSRQVREVPPTSAHPHTKRQGAPQRAPLAIIFASPSLP